MPKLDEVRWATFKVNELFNVEGTTTTHPDDLIPFGKTPRITTAATDNALDALYQNPPTEQGNVITIDSATDGFISYQPYSFISTDHVEKIYLKDSMPLSFELALFLVTSLKHATFKKYSYGYKFSQKRISNQIILLPIKETSETPHWDYMEQYVVNMTNKIKIPKLDPIKTSTKNLNSVEWQEFRISDVMDVLSGVRLTSSDMTSGDIPFIGATDSNNGITNWTSDINTSTDSNVLGVNYNGSVGETFYHPYTATFSDDVKRLKIKERNVQSKEVYLFIKTMILQQKEKYAYGYKFNGNRMKAQKIMLPITKDKDINWQFMEDYIKSISNAHLI